MSYAADQTTDVLLARAVTARASDIHLESYEHFGWVRFRVDGVLKRVLELDGEPWQQLLSRFKVLARLDIAQRRLPQDGHFIFSFEGAEYDCRLSCCPVVYGEKLVIRILNPLTGIPAISEIGLSVVEASKVRSVLKSSQGMVLVTGPTGSGKTLTLYSFLNEMNNGERNIATIEDPAEIKLVGINQTEVNSKINLHFATVLRSLLRQDPDVIMVGEIRDLETAEIAVQAAYTGHLVLSTLHTNSAAATVMRLVDMGVPILNVVSALKLVMAQRLVRVLCPYCRRAQLLTSEQKMLYTALSASKVYEANPGGCDRCSGGYHGRRAIFEVLVFDEALKRWVFDHQIANLAIYLRDKGHQDLWQQGLAAVKYGVTSLSEFQRVIN